MGIVFMKRIFLLKQRIRGKEFSNFDIIYVLLYLFQNQMIFSRKLPGNILLQSSAHWVILAAGNR